MLTKTLPVWRLCPMLLVLVLGTGCSGTSGVTVSGKLVLPKGLKLGDNDTVTIGFHPEDASKKAATGTYSAADNSFTAKDVTPGKNKITINITPYPGPDREKKLTQLEPLNKKYSDKETKLIYDVGREGSQSITIDAETGTVTKG